MLSKFTEKTVKINMIQYVYIINIHGLIKHHVILADILCKICISEIKIQLHE
jgi:hypothetical protein